MAMNNPYSAYQKYATVKAPQVREGHSTNTTQPTSSSAPPNVISMNVQQHPANKMADQYLENSVNTASPEELTLMLYDGAIRFMNKAIIHIEMNNPEKGNVALVKAQDIFSELMVTLKMDYEISSSLYNLYDFFKRSLIQANIKKDTGLIKEIIELTRGIRDTWAEAMKKAKKG